MLPKRSDELWQTDVTYLPIPGYGWWYAVTVIDYYSRYLLGLHFTHSSSAVEVSKGLRLATDEAERIHGPLRCPVFLVTDSEGDHGGSPNPTTLPLWSRRPSLAAFATRWTGCGSRQRE